MKDKKIDYEGEPQLWRKRKKNLTPKSYQMSNRRPSARRSPRRPQPPLQRPRHPPRNWGWRPCFGRWPYFQHYNRVTIQDWLPFLKKKKFMKNGVFSNKWSRNIFRTERGCVPAKFSKTWISVEKFKFSQILLGDKNTPYLCSKISSTLYIRLFIFGDFPLQ